MSSLFQEYMDQININSNEIIRRISIAHELNMDRISEQCLPFDKKFFQKKIENLLDKAIRNAKTEDMTQISFYFSRLIDQYRQGLSPLVDEAFRKHLESESFYQQQTTVDLLEN